MSTRDSSVQGIVYTFYSYKGGVGRSMAVANSAALLAKWGHSVLVVDWDIEAPGLDRFFAPPGPLMEPSAPSKPGIVDLMEGKANGSPLDWRECLQEFRLNGNPSPVSLISAGRGGHDYIDRMQRLDFPALFSKQNLGAYIEELRRDWTSNFEFVLVDSRTGVTDIGGICTVHLADVLVLLFTATHSSVDGCLEILNRAQEARQHLPLDRGRLLAIPLPSRDESRTEYERAAQWKKTFAEKFEPLYINWLADKKSIPEVIEMLRIPYVPYWSFGERLPAIEESPGDPAGLAYAYQVLARLLESKLNWNEALKGQTILPQAGPKQRHLDDAWRTQNRLSALLGLKSASKRGFMEIYHCCVDSPIDRTQTHLLNAARLAAVHTFGWPIGVVLDRDEARPSPTNEGIRAEIKASAVAGGEIYDYWVLTAKGDFYTLMSLFEDDREQGAVFFDTRIVRTTEALLHCANLYRALGADSNATIEFRMAYGGLRGRKISSSTQHRAIFPQNVNRSEDEMNASVVFSLNRLESEITQLVIKLCSPLFVLFDFFSLREEVYRDLVENFVAGKII